MNNLAINVRVENSHVKITAMEGGRELFDAVTDLDPTLYAPDEWLTPSDLTPELAELVDKFLSYV